MVRAVARRAVTLVSVAIVGFAALTLVLAPPADAKPSGGNAQSNPDGGAVDKPDGNNGCGNDADRDDDNNGSCGRRPGVATAAAPTPTRTAAPARTPRAASMAPSAVTSVAAADMGALVTPWAAAAATLGTTTIETEDGVRRVQLASAERPNRLLEVLASTGMRVLPILLLAGLMLTIGGWALKDALHD